MTDPTFILAFLAFLTSTIGGAYNYIVRRNERKAFERLSDAKADGEEINNLSDLLDLVRELRQQRAQDFDDILALKNEVATLTQKVELLQAGRTRDRRVINVALKHIEELRTLLIGMNVQPPSMPELLLEWRREYRKNGGDDDG